MGGKKFTKISPNKTFWYIGFFYTFNYFWQFFLFIILDEFLILNQNILLFLFLLSLSISQLVIYQFHTLKGKLKIKDTGSILPGHGGVLDRIDGILFAIPIGIIFTFFIK